MTTSAKRAALACALLATTCLAAPALAQTTQFPAFANPDANGVDVTHGSFLLSFLEGSIGSGEGELSLVRIGIGNSAHTYWDDMEMRVSLVTGGATLARVRLGRQWDTFTNGVPAKANGATLTGPAAWGDYVFRAADGTTITFSPKPTSAFQNGCVPSTQRTCTFIPVSITSPNGKTVSLTWDSWTVCNPQQPDDCWVDSVRLAAISNSFGYAIRFTHALDGEGSEVGPPPSWFQRTGATFHNTAISEAVQASVAYATSGTVTNVTDTGGRVWRFTDGGGRVAAIRRPGASADTTTIAYSNGIVTSVTRDGVTTNYSRSVSGNTVTAVITNALSQATTVVSDLVVGRPTSITDPLSRTTGFQYDANGRLTRVTAPEQNYVQYTYDARGNVTQTQRVAKPSSGLATITTSASFDASCANPVKCNEPNTTTDERGNVTNYDYDPTHGGVTKVTLPAPTTGAVRPETRYAYTLTNGEYRLTGISACQTGSASSCVGTADEVKTSLAYDANGNIVSSSSGAGDASLTATNAMTYDALGNLLTKDGPLAGTADTVRHRYNAARELVGTVSPDPDGGGTLKHRALRNTYTNGLLTKAERGTVNSQSDGDWAAFAALEAVDTVYDANARPVTRKLVAGGTTYALTQTGYDAVGRPECVAQRMNPAAFGSLPASACTLGTQGSFGPDRIAKTVYDAAGQVTQAKTALGTADEANEATMFYTPNGLLWWVIDGESNRTQYAHDGHDRYSIEAYPVPSKGADQYSQTDQKHMAYDAAGNLTSRKLRDGQYIYYTYDALNRLTFIDMPNNHFTELDITRTYDNLGRLLSATTAPNFSSFTYDALGRVTSESDLHGGTSTMQYDLAGRRTRLIYPGTGLYVDYDYLITGDMKQIRENGATSGVGLLATFSYDDLGRRTALARGNGTSTAYGYDPVSRVASLSEDLGGSAYDQLIALTYNPASQATGNSRANDLYAWTAHGSGSTGATTNGLNQLVNVGAASIAHDARGNLTNDGAVGYSYNVKNQLISPSLTGSLFWYDPLGRLSHIGNAGWNSFQIFDYVGTEAVAENGSWGAVLRRYVYGPGTDEPLVWYEGSGTSDRRFLHADERGSIVAVSDSAGNILGINKYDEYGLPQGPSGAGTLYGRFGYTGQAWLPEAGLYYYKARMYHPRLGRFMQTDPIGYEAGMNLYAYVQGDPVNLTDPLGLDPKDDEDVIVVTGRSGRGGGNGAGGPRGGVGKTKTRNSPGLVQEVFQAVDEVEEAVQDIVVVGKRATNAAANITKYPTRWLAHALGLWKRPSLPTMRSIVCGCLEAGTLVSTPSGFRRIEDIRVGDLVLAKEAKTGKIGPKRVIDLVHPAPKPLYAVRMRSESGTVEILGATDDHPWEVSGRNWVSTTDLRVGDKLVTADGEPLEILSVTLTGRTERTYNLTVEDWHTFLVGKERAVVHNVDCLNIDKHAARSMRKRGWTEDDVRDAQRNPIATVRARDTRHNLDGTTRNDPATAFYSQGGGYAVINDVNGDLVQVSPRDLTGWSIPWEE